MILLQSYRYVSFSPEVTKIKVSNALRMFSKRFEKELMAYLNKVVEDEIDNIREKKEDEDEMKKEEEIEEEEGNSYEVVERVSV